MIEKQEPVAWTDKYGEDFCHKSTNYFNVPLYTALQPCPECEKLKAALDLIKTLVQQSNQDHLNARLDYQGEIIGLKAERDELAAHLTQTQQELFLTKGSLMVRDKQLEETDALLQKAMQQNIELQTELEMLHDVLETTSDIHEKTEKQLQYLQTTLDHMND